MQVLTRGGALLLAVLAVNPWLGAQEAAPTSDPQAVATINRYLQALGGKETLKAIKDKQVRFTNKRFSPTNVTEMKMARFMKHGFRIREEWELPGQGLLPNNEPLRFVQVYDGARGWVKTMGYVSELKDKTLTIFVWDKYIDDFFMHYEEDGYTVKMLPETKIEGRDCVGVETRSFAGGFKVRYYFAKDDGLLVKKQWNDGTGKTLTVKETLYRDYKKIRFRDNREKWVMMALTELIFGDGELELEMSYSEVTLNAGLEDKLFGRPDGPAFEERQKPEPKKTDEAGTPGATTKPTTRAKLKPLKPLKPVKPASRPAAKPTSQPRG